MFWIENALFLAAALVFITPAGRASQRASFLGAVALLAGGSLYRLDAYLIGYQPLSNWSYFPSVPELMVSIGVIALEDAALSRLHQDLARAARRRRAVANRRLP